MNPNKKRLLALDGGGIRGLITIEVLAALERTLRTELRRGADFRLADYFDYVAGTSTGAIIAACVALGMSVDEIRGFYLGNGKAMFDKAALLRRFRYKFEDDRLAETLQAVFDRYLPQGEKAAGKTHVTLGSSALKTLLLVVMRNATTDSPWPVSSNPKAKYNDRKRDDCNLDLPLWQLVRASTAAPTYFPPEEVRMGPRSFLFVDGGVTTYNNPAFILFLMSTVSAYNLCWPTGGDRMLLLSIGTGTNPEANASLAAGEMNLIYNASTIPSALMFAALNEQDLLCRVFGNCRYGGLLDREIGTLMPPNEPVLPKLFTYARYNVELTRAGLDELGLTDVRPEEVQKLDSLEHMSDLTRIGERLGAKVSPVHLAGFLD
jgi:patatin-like phospholipase/acyl hydrolase